ncbi:hypothetical protein [Photorhabdus temperata]|uniref:Uncharacterized protein n=1 Tax=Photorhabdus temperata J3 TaxID=1389415 RepID=U7QUG5_PHOTE|nr:hypothetical protein [Photorhabdus temperata]ERT11508.1 hypothetical protein O185_19545 [Photorhabdus temperata J3]
MNFPLTNNHDMVAELNWIYPHLERIDLLLQRYYYQKRDWFDSLPESFLLTEDEVDQRLAEPQGIPHWLKTNNIVGNAETDGNSTSGALSLLIERNRS